jgi:HTH-type transcriptional regulator/antitoxin HigA
MAEKSLVSISPGEYLREELIARNWTPEHFATQMDLPLATVTQIVVGAKEVTPDIAQKIAQVMGTSTALWLNLESAYRSDLGRLSAQASTGK